MRPTKVFSRLQTSCDIYDSFFRVQGYPGFHGSASLAQIPVELGP